MTWRGVKKERKKDRRLVLNKMVSLTKAVCLFCHAMEQYSKKNNTNNLPRLHTGCVLYLTVLLTFLTQNPVTPHHLSMLYILQRKICSQAGLLSKDVLMSLSFRRAEDLPPTWTTRRLFQLWLKLPDWQLCSACHWALLPRALRYEACMLMDPSADDMMEDCYPSHSPLVDWILLVLEKRKKIWQKKLKGLLATRKQIIGRGFVLRNKLAGMFSYSIFNFFSRHYAFSMNFFCTAACIYASSDMCEKCVRLWCPLGLLSF